MKKIKRNFKAATAKGAIKDVLVGAIVGPVIYTMVPTLLKMHGPGGVAVGAVSTWAVGAVTGQRGIQIAGPVCAGIHMMYVYGNNFVADVLGRPIFRYTPGACPPGQICDGPTDVVNVGGERILAQRATDMPAPAYTAPPYEGVNDPIRYQLEDFVPAGTVPPVPERAPRRGVSRGRSLTGRSVAAT